MGTLIAKQRPSAVEIHELLILAQSAGADIDTIARDAGLVASNLLSDCHRAALSQEQFSAIIFAAAKALEERSCARLQRQPMTKLDFDLLCYCVINCTTLEAAIQRASEFMHVLGMRAAKLTLHGDAGIAHFTMDTQRGVDRDGFLPDLIGLSGYARLFSWLIGEDIQPMTLSMAHPQRLSHELATLIAPYFIMYSKSKNQLHFPTSYLKRPVIRNHDELQRMLRYFPFDGCTLELSNAQLSPKIRRPIIAALQCGTVLPSAQVLARQLNISIATLRRRLHEEGTSISQLRDQCRHTLAMQLLQQRNIALAQIAERLGYSDASAFRRAFSAWTGTSPTHHRDTLRVVRNAK